MPEYLIHMATVKDVATKAAVSLGTVSRVLNRHPAVSAENVARVLKAVREVGYIAKPPRAGPNLRTGNLGLLLLGMDRSLASLPVIAQTVQSVQAEISRLGANTLMADLPGLDVIPPFLERGSVDGLVVKGPLQGALPAPGKNRLVDRLRAMPTVWVLGRPEGAWSDHCGPDNWAIGRLAAQRLVSKGHRHLAYVSVRGRHTMFDERQASFEWHARTLGAAAHTFVSARPDSVPWPLPSAGNQDEMDRLVKRMRREAAKCTGIYVPADTMAAQLFRSLAQVGLRIGKDIAVVSTNNEPPIIASLAPTLTTIDVRADAIGTRAVEQLLWRIGHLDRPGNVNVSQEPVLVEGESG